MPKGISLLLYDFVYLKSFSINNKKTDFFCNSFAREFESRSL